MLVCQNEIRTERTWRPLDQVRINQRYLFASALEKLSSELNLLMNFCNFGSDWRIIGKRVLEGNGPGPYLKILCSSCLVNLRETLQNLSQIGIRWDHFQISPNTNSCSNYCSKPLGKKSIRYLLSCEIRSKLRNLLVRQLWNQLIMMIGAVFYIEADLCYYDNCARWIDGALLLPSIQWRLYSKKKTCSFKVGSYQKSFIKPGNSLLQDSEC